MRMTPAPRDRSLPPVRINLMSDTQTRPTPGMREAMARAEVGDEQIGDDPTTNALCERVAELLGKQAAVFMPSGTMCNVAATLVHCRPGDEILAHPSAHVLTREGGAHAALGGFQITALPGDDGLFTPDTLRAAIQPPSRYSAPQRVVTVEQTANIGGGCFAPTSGVAGSTRNPRAPTPHDEKSRAEPGFSRSTNKRDVRPPECSMPACPSVLA